MYFPYLRGRQFELLALRELTLKKLLSSRVIPVVEPVKLSSTLLKTMEVFVENKKELGIIWNPAVGTFEGDMKSEENDSNREKFLNLLNEPYIIKSHIMANDSKKQIEECKINEDIHENDLLIICNNRDLIELYLDIFKKTPPRYVLLSDEFRRKIREKKVLFEDKFEKCERNSDYAKNCDEFFSEDHLFYKAEGFEGFADYSVIGKDYLEAGFAPYAVAIHIVYFADDESLRIHHFISDSNEDYQNPAKKFYEAVEKLSNWVGKNDVQMTAGLTELLQHYEKQTYPGLGSVKKLSLMHHLELVGRYLDEVK